MDELNPKKMTQRAMIDPIILSNPKLVEMILIMDPSVIMEQFPKT